MKRLILSVVAGMCIYCSPAFASEATEKCDDTNWTAVDGTDLTAETTPTQFTVRGGECLAYRFTTTEDSDPIYMPSGGWVFFYPSIDGSDAAQIYIRLCAGGNKTYSVNTCRPIETELGTQVFTGAAGLWARELPPGTYVVDNSVSAGGDTAVVVFQGKR